MKHLRRAAAGVLALLAGPALADVWYIYQPAPNAATVSGEGIFLQVNDRDRTEPRINETFHLTTTLSGGTTAASARLLFSDVTLTTDSTGSVVAWTATGSWQRGFVSWVYDSSLQADQFTESITFVPVFVGSPSGPFFSPEPGRWVTADAPIPIPEPASAVLLLGGLGIIAGARLRGRRAVGRAGG